MSVHPATDTRLQILDTARALIAGRGFSAVGLSEILGAAAVPRGSFYHWFRSKEQFGEALLERHFQNYLVQVDACLSPPGQSAPQRLLAFFSQWRSSQSGDDPQARCLVVKLSAEVCDLSEAMRGALERGTAQVIARLASCLAQGIANGELAACPDPAEVAQQLYQQWLGATLLARVQRSPAPLDQALAQTTRWLASQVRES
ncbi:MAG: bacterial regulatory s, tetR family protein [Ramlibacter sp.]|uniref:TetR/AcrR family transcriptional regulator n=1 Tax=Ramlibacter sp. TaxID=1917967 RepID=UPI0026176026|nr:TetR/AcrR family transcriptional regulator [Ramlibacter sp.]MDB5752687.1 bacterial regulatory s, tetR family protein [Ramlibacter sp.]